MRAQKYNQAEVEPGTKRYEILQMLLSDRGSTVPELRKAGLLGAKSSIINTLEHFRDRCGYDIRRFQFKENPRCAQRGRPVTIYKIVGRQSYDGSQYEEYIDVAKLTQEYFDVND